jgi:hypothetical protein
MSPTLAAELPRLLKELLRCLTNENIVMIYTLARKFCRLYISIKHFFVCGIGFFQTFTNITLLAVLKPQTYRQETSKTMASWKFEMSAQGEILSGVTPDTLAS